MSSDEKQEMMDGAQPANNMILLLSNAQTNAILDQTQHNSMQPKIIRKKMGFDVPKKELVSH
jgi:hypothetical protein